MAGLSLRQRLASISLRRAAKWFAACLAAFVPLCWAIVAAFGGFPGDGASADEVEEEDLSGIALAPAHALDWLGHPVPALLTSVGVAGLFLRLAGPRHAALVVGALGASVVTFALKELFDRTRPEGGLGLDDPSYPSGHTTWATALFTVAALFAAQQRRWGLSAAAAFLVAAMGPSRVLLGVHWASDVMAGYAVALAWVTGLLLVGWSWAQRDRAVEAT